MRRTLLLAAATGLALLAGLAPATAQGVSTPLSTQENVRHLATVPGTTGGHVVVEGNRLYMGNYGTGLSAYDISNVRSPMKIGQYLPGPSANDGADPGVRADAVPDAAVWDDRHIVSFGGTNRFANRIQTEFIDFTDPESPELLWRFTQAPDRESHNGDLVDARKLFLPSGGGGNDGLRIYDMRPVLEDPPKAPQRLFIGNPHTLWNNSPYRSYYGKPLGGAFNHTHDIEIYTDREILLPEWEWDFDPETGERIPTRGKRDIALLAAAGGGNASGAVYTIDITDPRAPVVISKWQNPSGAGHNAISYLHEVQFVDGDPNTMVVTDEDMTSGCQEGRLYSVDISDDLVHTTKAGEWTVGAGQADTQGTCLGSHVISTHDQHVFMGAYTAGLQVIDVRDPANMETAGRYIAEGQNSWGALYHNGVVYTGDFGGRGLDVFEFIKEPAARGFLKVGNPTSRLAATGGGITELLGGCDPEADANEVDGLLVQIPQDKRDGSGKIRAFGSGAPGAYDVDVWFYGEGCTFMSGIADTFPEFSGDAQGDIPEGAAYAYVDLYLGAPQWVYAQIL